MTALAVVTPVWNERARLLACLETLRRQTLRPRCWVIVDSGSTDGTIELAHALAQAHDWIDVRLANPERVGRGAPIAHTLNAGVAQACRAGDVIALMDADVSFEPEFMRTVATAFERDERLGIAGGLQLERVRGRWRANRATCDFVPSPLRVFRRTCLEEIAPFDEGLGWEGLVHVRAALAGWRTEVLPELAFRHLRREGARVGRRRYWLDEGAAAYCMGYRPTYVLYRALFRAAEPDPAALMMLPGFARAALRRETRTGAERERAWLREKQRLRELPVRVREALLPIRPDGLRLRN